jgi:hypothetical protein
MTGQKKPQTELTGQLMDKLFTATSNRKLTVPNLYMIFYPPIIEYTGMTRPDPLNAHCASIGMTIEIIFDDAHMPLEDNGERTSETSCSLQNATICERVQASLSSYWMAFPNG